MVHRVHQGRARISDSLVQFAMARGWRESAVEQANMLAPPSAWLPRACACWRWLCARAAAGRLGVEAVESGLSLIGLVGLIDPPRPEAALAVRDRPASRR